LAVTLGKADFAKQLAILNPNLLAFGNLEAGYDMSPTINAGLGMSPAQSNMYGNCAGNVQQYLWTGTGNTQFATLVNSGSSDAAGFTSAMIWYQNVENILRTAPNYPIITGPVAANDYQVVRYTLTFTLMRNGWAQYAISNSNNDNVDPSVSSGFPVFDEFWGGSLNLAGYLGAAYGGPLGAEQSASWLQGVWRRDFFNGIALVNPAGNGSQTVALGGTLYHLRGTQVPGINNGTAVTSVTVPAGDGLILLRVAPP